MIGFGFTERLNRLILVSAHCYLSNVDIAVGGLHEAQILGLHTFTGSGKLCHCGKRRRFGRLTAGVGVNFRVHDEDIDVFAGG